MRSGGRILIDGLLGHGADTAFCVPGESFLGALDAMYACRDRFRLITCRQEGGAAYMAEAWGKLSGNPGICFVSRGPGASNAMVGIHTAFQDSTPLICFVGQVPRRDRGREAFQELDYHRVFSAVAKKVISIDDARRIPEQLNQAWQTAVSGRQGPVVVVLYEDMLRDEVTVADLPPASAHLRFPPAPPPAAVLQVGEALRAAERPLVICGNTGWTGRHQQLLSELAETHQVPVAAAFRRQDSFDNTHPNYIGELGLSIAPPLREYIGEADLLLVIGPRLGEMTTEGYELVPPPTGFPGQQLIHIHPAGEEPGSVFHADIAVQSESGAFLAAMQGLEPGPVDRRDMIATMHARYQAWVEEPVSKGDGVRMDAICAQIRATLPAEAIVTVGAGSYTGWGQRFYQYRLPGTQLGSTNGTMGYSAPAAIAAKLLHPERLVVSFNGDGCFMMNGQEFATAVQYGIAVVFLVINNGRLGTIRAHQERHYPGRVSGTDLVNPDFARLADAYGGKGYTVHTNAEFLPAFRAALDANIPSLIDIHIP
jgi:acetolactate synthase-1/2/3 large subunit